MTIDFCMQKLTEFFNLLIIVLGWTREVFDMKAAKNRGACFGFFVSGANALHS